MTSVHLQNAHWETNPLLFKMNTTHRISLFPILYVPSYKSIYFNLSKLDFTQLLILSLLSKSFFWRTSPTPPGDPNFSTMALVFLNCFSSIKCWTHFRYVSRVCFSGGTGTFGNTWGHKIIILVWNTRRLTEAEPTARRLHVLPLVHRTFTR